MIRTARTAHVIPASVFAPARWRVWLASGLAASALAISTPLTAGALLPDCGNTTGTAVFDAGSNALTCSGNQSPGISTFADTLFVIGLTGNIAPGAGLHGIELFGSNSVTLQSMLGGFSIITTGPVAHGINADRQQGVMIEHQGNISATGPGSIGIRGRASQGEVSISSRGNITAGESGAGIFANTTQGAIVIQNNGDITGGGHSSGIRAIIDQSGNAASISITSKGDIEQRTQHGPVIQVTAGIFAEGYNDISIVSAGNISVMSDHSHGISATTQSGSISLTTSGNITAKGSDGSAIYIDGGDTNTIRILGGTISSASANNSVISINGRSGGTNTVDNYGSILSNPFTSTTISSNGLSRTVINNFGSISGDVELYLDPENLPLVPNTFNNERGAVFNLSSAALLGTGAVLTNRGTLAPGGPGVALSAIIDGNLIQSTTGQIGIDIDMSSGASDRIDVTGSAQLAGKVVPNLIKLGSLLTQAFKIIGTGDGVTNNGLTVSDTALIDYSLLYPNANDVVLSARVNFDVPGLTPNQESVLDYFGRGGASGGADLQSTLSAILNAPDIATVAAITEQLTSNASSAAATSALHSSDALAAALRSCPVAEGPNSELRETSCLWAKPTYRQFKQDKGRNRTRIDDDTSGISGGFQTTIGENAWGGLGFSVENSNSNIDGTTSIDGTWWQIGGVAKWTEGAMKLSASVSGGQGGLDTLRSISIPGLAAVASSDSDVGFASGLLRFAYSFNAGALYVTPMFNGGINHIRFGGFTESGAGGLNLAAHSASKTIFSGGPALELGTTIEAGGLTFRPYARFGVTFLSEGSITTEARFAAAPATLAPFAIQSEFDNVYADISAGVQWFSASGIHLRLNYDGRIGGNSEQHGIDAKLTLNY